MATNNPVNNMSDDFKTTAQTIDPGVAGDGFVQYIIDGDEFIMGCDDSDGDAFVISQGNALGVNNVFKMSPAGERTLPLQSCFLARASTTYLNSTGAGAQYTCLYTDEIYDQNNNFDAISTFTAPVDGRYLFHYSVQARKMTVTATTGNIELTTTKRNYVSYVCDYGALFDPLLFYLDVTGKGIHYADMDLGDTAMVKVQISGMPGDTVTVFGDVNKNYFSAQLMC